MAVERIPTVAALPHLSLVAEVVFARLELKRHNQHLTLPLLLLLLLLVLLLLMLLLVALLASTALCRALPSRPPPSYCC